MKEKGGGNGQEEEKKVLKMAILSVPRTQIWTNDNKKSSIFPGFSTFFYLDGGQFVFVWTLGGPMVAFTNSALNDFLSLEFIHWIVVLGGSSSGTCRV